MGKTRRVRQLKQTVATHRNVDDWFERMVDDFGWTAMAKAKGYTFRVTNYTRTLKNLKNTIEGISREYKGANQKRDMKALHEKVEWLIEYSDAHL